MVTTDKKTSEVLKRCREKVINVAIDLARAGVERGAKEVIKTYADVYGHCLKRKIFTKNDLQVLKQQYPSGGTGPSAMVAKDALEEMCRRGIASKTKSMLARMTVIVYDIAKAGEDDNGDKDDNTETNESTT